MASNSPSPRTRSLDDADTVALSQGELVTLVGNLVDNAIDAARADAPGWVEVTVRGTDQALTVAVADSGPGNVGGRFRAGPDARLFDQEANAGPRAGAGVAGDRGHGGTITSENTYGSVITATIPAAQPGRSRTRS